MFYREEPAGPPLSSFVKCLWALERDYGHDARGREHLWADVNGELVFVSGAGYSFGEAARAPRLPAAFVIGPFTKPFDLHSDGVTRLVSARLDAWGFFHLGARRVERLVDTITAAETIFGAWPLRLAAMLADLPVEMRIQALRLELAAQIPSRQPASSVADMARWLDAQAGTGSISELSTTFGLSARTIQRAFREQTGLTPKRYARIVMFNHAKHRIENESEIDLAALASEAGYADQAHFTKAFKELFDVTPAAFKDQVREGRAYLAATGSSVAFLQDRDWENHYDRRMKTHLMRLAAAAAAHWVAGAVWYGLLASSFVRLIGEEKLRELQSRSEATAFAPASAAAAVLLVERRHVTSASAVA